MTLFSVAAYTLPMTALLAWYYWKQSGTSVIALVVASCAIAITHIINTDWDRWFAMWAPIVGMAICLIILYFLIDKLTVKWITSAVYLLIVASLGWYDFAEPVPEPEICLKIAIEIKGKTQLDEQELHSFGTLNDVIYDKNLTLADYLNNHPVFKNKLTLDNIQAIIINKQVPKKRQNTLVKVDQRHVERWSHKSLLEHHKNKSYLSGVHINNDNQYVPFLPLILETNLAGDIMATELTREIRDFNNAN